MSEFRTNLKLFREQAGLSGRELAKRIDVPYSTYNKYESARNEPKYDVLRRIAEVLGVSIDALIGYEPPHTAFLLESLIPMLMDSEIEVRYGGEKECIVLLFRGKMWQIPILEAEQIFNDVNREVDFVERKKALYRRFLEYFALHDAIKKASPEGET